MNAHTAAIGGNSEAIKCLLGGLGLEEREAMVNVKNRNGSAAIHRAAVKGQTYCDHCLLNRSTLPLVCCTRWRQ